MGILRLHLKITILIFMILIAFLFVILWPKSSEETGQNKVNDNLQVKLEKEEESSAEQLYQKALALKQKSESLSIEDQKEILDYCGQIIKQYPDSPEAEKAKALRNELYEQLQEQYANQLRTVRYNQPKVQKSKPLRRTFRGYRKPERIAVGDSNSAK